MSIIHELLVHNGLFSELAECWEVHVPSDDDDGDHHH